MGNDLFLGEFGSSFSWLLIIEEVYKLLKCKGMVVSSVVLNNRVVYSAQTTQKC